MKTNSALKIECQAGYSVITAADGSEIEAQIEKLVDSTWPAYAVYGRPPEMAKFEVDWSSLYKNWPSFQFGITDNNDGKLIATGNALPIQFSGKNDDLPDEGWDWAVHTGKAQYLLGLKPNTLIPLAITVHKEYRQLGLSRVCLETMRAIASSHGLTQMFAPVRPSMKSKHPNTSIDEYVTWKSLDGSIFDPWLRTHVKFGGSVIKPCKNSMTFVASLKDWNKWTGLEFSKSGNFEVPDLLAPLKVDMETETGSYVEPNVWVAHTVPSTNMSVGH